MVYSLKKVLKYKNLKKWALKNRLNKYKRISLEHVNLGFERFRILKLMERKFDKLKALKGIHCAFDKPKALRHIDHTFDKLKALERLSNNYGKRSKIFQPINKKFDKFKALKSIHCAFDKPKVYQPINKKFDKFKQVNSKYSNYYRIRKHYKRTHYINFARAWVHSLSIKRSCNFNKFLEANGSILLFWFIYLFNLFNFLLPNIIMKKLLDLTNIYLYHDWNKYHYHFKLISLYPYKKFDCLIYDDLIRDKEFSSFLNYLAFSLSYNDFFFKKKLVQLYNNFSLKFSNKLLGFRFLLNLSRKRYRRKLRIKRLLKRRRRRFVTRFNVKFLRRFSKRYSTKKKYFTRRKFKRGKLITRKRKKKKREFKMRLIV